METQLVWDEIKRATNLVKHGLDFSQAHLVLDSCYRLDVEVVRSGEVRVQSFSYVLEVLAVLTAVYADRDGAARIISFRRASGEECEVYDVWLENE